MTAAGKRVVLIYPVPEAGWNVPETYAKANLVGSLSELSYPVRAYEKRYGETVAFLDTLRNAEIYRVKPADIFCYSLIDGKCVQAQGNRIYYSDDDHLSNEGARLIAPEIVGQIEEAMRSSKQANEDTLPLPSPP